MGRDAIFYCVTCKVEIYLGYGSYSTWLDGARTVEEFDASAARHPDPDVASIPKNRAVRRALAEHAGHEWVGTSSDWSFVKDDTCYMDGGYTPDTVLVSGLDSYASLDYSTEKGSSE